MPVTVSVIVCAYNEQAYLADCLYSLKAQTLRPQELLVVDNASTDTTFTDAIQAPGIRLQRVHRLPMPPATAGAAPVIPPRHLTTL